MLAFMENLNGLELLFALCAIAGGTLFIFRLILMFMGHVGDTDVDGHVDFDGMHDVGGVDVDGGHDFAGHDASDSDVSFKLLSLQGITAFLMMFGLVGWAMMSQGDYHPMIPIIAGTAAGLATFWVMGKIFQFAISMQSSGTLKLQNAVGQEGSVYLTIKPNESGKVQVAVQNRMMILDAVAEGSQEIKTGQAVRVVKVVAGKLVVEKLKPANL